MLKGNRAHVVVYRVHVNHNEYMKDVGKDCFVEIGEVKQKEDRYKKLGVCI
jgi:hypothetical protein